MQSLGHMYVPVLAGLQHIQVRIGFESEEWEEQEKALRWPLVCLSLLSTDAFHLEKRASLLSIPTQSSLGKLRIMDIYAKFPFVLCGEADDADLEFESLIGAHTTANTVVL